MLSLRYKSAGALAAAAILAASITGCGSSKHSSASGSSSSSSSSSSSAPASSGSSGKKFTVALVPGDSTDPFFLSMENAGKAEAAKLGMSFIDQGASDYSPESQTPVLQSLLAKKPSALLVAPTDPNAITGILKQYQSANIPIITLDSTIDDSSILAARITSDNNQGGAAAADACGKIMKGTGSAAVIYTTPGTTTTNERGKAFIAEMKKKYPQVSTYSEFDNNEESTATSQVSSLLLGHSDMKCVFGTNDYAAEGAASAVGTKGDQGKVAIAGYDAEPQLVDLLKKGTINIIIAQKPGQEAALGVEDAYDLLTGKKGKVKASVQLSNVTMTKQNISMPSVAAAIYK